MKLPPVRDEFTRATRDRIAKLAGWRCSFPGCGVETVGANSDGTDVINIGTAAHICAASPGGPRYNSAMTPEQRRSETNGVWMCRDHGKAIDAADPQFSVAKLHEWKRAAEIESMRRVLRGDLAPVSGEPNLGRAATELKSAALADIAVFKRTWRWPSTEVPLTLAVEGLPEAASTERLAVAVATLDDLLLVAPPGMGKTATLFQIADALLTQNAGIPVIVPLGDWASDTATILGSILGRSAYCSVTEDSFRKAATQPGIILLLDGWNELDAGARERARVQLTAIKAELPAIGFMISTRRQTLDVPFPATRVDILPLGEQQQIDIATTMRGAMGTRILDTAWRTPGIRELITIPLYLVALLGLAESTPFPETKEELLRRFVAVQEQDPRRAEALLRALQGLQARYLVPFATLATSTGNTSLGDTAARASVARVQDALIEEGQIAIRQQPDAILEALVSNHVLLRSGDGPGYGFQHQQFQEWYASQYAERVILEAAASPAAQGRLTREIFDRRPWEEAVLFAVERLSRGSDEERKACADAILSAFEVDPMLAAEMIFRSTDAVWTRIESEIQQLVRGWHTPGRVDRAVSFMISAARPEFLDLVWPLLSSSDSQVLLPAARAGSRFRTAILGANAEAMVASLPVKVRSNLLHEIASRSGMDGIDLATAIAGNDPDPEIKRAVVDALAFRRANSHVASVLKTADDDVFDHVARTRLVDEVPDEAVQRRLDAARARLLALNTSPADVLQALISLDPTSSVEAQLTETIARLPIDPKEERLRYLIFEALRRHPEATADGLLRRLRDGAPLMYDTEHMLAAAGFALEEDALTEIALAPSERRERRANAAASVLGPIATGKLVEAYLEAGTRLRDASGAFNQAAGDHFHALRDRLAHVSGRSLVTAVQARASGRNFAAIERLAELLTRRSEEQDERARPFDTAARLTIEQLAQSWGGAGARPRSGAAALSACSSCVSDRKPRCAAVARASGKTSGCRASTLACIPRGCTGVWMAKQSRTQ